MAIQPTKILLIIVLLAFVVSLFLLNTPSLSQVRAHGSHKHSSESHHHHHNEEHHHHDHHEEEHEEHHHHNTQHKAPHRHLLETTTSEKHDHHHEENKKPSKLSVWMYSLGSSFGVSLLSFVGASLLFYGIRGEQNNTTNLQFILSCLAVGSLLGDCFLHLLPILYTSSEHHEQEHNHSHGGKHVHNLEASGHSFVILFGFILCLLIEVYLRVRQKREEKKEKAHETAHQKHGTNTTTGHHHGHSHIKAVGWINLIGDGIHNFMDGAGIAGAFQISIPVGIANVLCICMHEIPQELSDYGILLSAGFSVKKALFFNFLSGVLSVVGCLFGLILTSDHGFEFLFINEKHLVALSAGSFMYIATSMIPIILDQLVESDELNVDTSSQKPNDEKSEKKHKDTQVSEFPNKLLIAIGSVTCGIILMHIIGVYEDSVTDMVTSFYR